MCFHLQYGQCCYNLLFKNNIFYSSQANGAKFTIKMMKDYSFENNTYINIDSLEGNIERKIDIFNNALDFTKESNIFKRKQQAENNLKEFKEFIYKGDYKL